MSQDEINDTYQAILLFERKGGLLFECAFTNESYYDKPRSNQIFIIQLFKKAIPEYGPSYLF